MATVSASQIQYNQSILSVSGFPVENWRIAAGATPGDTCVITPARFDLVKSVFGPVTSNISTTPVTAVTVTIASVTGTAITDTVGAVDVWIVGYQGN